MKKVRRALVLFLAMFMIIAVFGGCNKKADGEAEQNNTDVTKNPQASNSTVYYLNSKPEYESLWQELGEKYTEAKGVEVKVVSVSAEDYEETLESELVSKEPPTLFWASGSADLAKWKDYCYDLRESAPYRSLKSGDFALKSESGEALAVAYVIDTYGIVYNKELLDKYAKTEGAVITDVSEITGFEKLKAVAEDIQSKKDELGINGAFAPMGTKAGSAKGVITQLANIPVYYEYKDGETASADTLKGTYLENLRAIWDLYINNATVPPDMIFSKTEEEAAEEFATCKAVFFQSSTQAYEKIAEKGQISDKNLGMLPIYIGAEREENQGLATGSENYWCVNKKAKKEDIKATLKFLEWVITSEEGKNILTFEMNCVTPFKTFGEEHQAKNPLVLSAEKYIEEGKTPVTLSLNTFPGEKWKENLATALMNYSKGAWDWSEVESAFVDSWEAEYETQNNII